MSPERTWWMMNMHCGIWNMYPKSNEVSTGQKATIHQVTTVLATSKNVLFSGHSHLLTSGTDDSSLTGTQVIIKVSGHQYRWLASAYDLEIGYF